MIKLIIVMILSALAVVWVFPKWSKERQMRIDRHKFMEEWSAKEIMLFILWILFTTVFALGVIGFIGFILSVF